MATPDNDDDEVEVDEEAEEGGDLDTSLKLFMKKANWQKKKKPGRKPSGVHGHLMISSISLRITAHIKRNLFSQIQRIREMESCMEKFWKKLKAELLLEVNTTISLWINCEASSKNVSLCKQAVLTQKSATVICLWKSRMTVLRKKNYLFQ